MVDTEQQPSTPKKSGKRKRTQTPKKPTKGTTALQFFSGPFNRVVNDVEIAHYICSFCNRELNGNNISNLANHIRVKHEITYEEYYGRDGESIDVERLKLLQNCVSIVALGGRPFASLSDFGFQRIIDAQLKKFTSAGIPLDLKQKHQPAVHEHLTKCAQEVTDAIKNAIKRNAVSIQLDIAPRLGRSIFGINVQYPHNKKLNMHSIGMLELKQAHTGKYLSKVYRECLEKHDIIKQQVISISGDNGANVQKFIGIQQDDAKNNSPQRTPVARRLDFNCATRPQRDVATIDREIESVLATEEITDDENVILEIFEECGIDLTETTEHSDEHAVLLRETIAEISNEYGHNLFNLTGINCAAHVLQLLVKDALKALRKESSNIIDLSRRIIKALKLSSTKIIVQEAGISMKVPSLDVETRWGSMYVMVSRFIDIFYID